MSEVPQSPEKKHTISIPSYQLPERIDSIVCINNIPLTHIESDMKPGKYSMNGFIGKDESLLQLLQTDNLYVKNNHLTHTSLAEALFIAKQAFLDHEKQFLFNDNLYNISGIVFGGKQDSPFQDGTSTRIDIMVSTANNYTLTFSGLVPEMIARYGFYEGIHQRYRLEPKNIIDMFHLK
jgi:hypothetical protein